MAKSNSTKGQRVIYKYHNIRRITSALHMYVTGADPGGVGGAPGARPP